MHPYTRGLLSSIPSFNPGGHVANRNEQGKKPRLDTIQGIVPNLLELPTGCRFQTRCPFASDECRNAEPNLRAIFQKLNDEGHTIVMITHEPDIAGHAKRVIVIKDGKIIDDKLNKKRT
jgi:oligopeptide/dipeptide ABC transporter ATP-binding protein